MAEVNALNIATQYLEKVKSKYENFQEAWLFGSYAKGSKTSDSDIDLAIVFKEIDSIFNKNFELMQLRNNFELLIEPHSFDFKDFNMENPFAEQVIKYGIKIG